MYQANMEFPDFHSFLDACRGTNPSRCSNAYDSGMPSFYGSKSYEETMDLAEHGWPQGLEMIRKVQSETPIRDKEIWMHSIAGAIPDVPLFLAGSPEHMMSQHREPKKTMTIEIARGVRGFTSIEDYMAHGAMVLSLLDYAEEAGHPIELYITIYASSGRHDYVHRILAKKAGEHMDMDRLAFMMAHPSFHRRLIFSLREMVGDVGGSGDVPKQFRIPDAIYIPMLFDIEQINTLREKFLEEIAA